MINKPHIAYKDYTLEDLFKNISHSGHMYAISSSEGEVTYNDGKNVMPTLDTLPKAMLYRARVIEQVVDEIKARAYLLQQKEYNLLDKEDKIKYHMSVIKGWEDSLDEEDTAYEEHQIQLHDSAIHCLENYNFSNYEFGDTL